MTMPRRDARSLSHDALEEMRRLAIRRLDEGERVVDIARSIEVHPNTVSKWGRAYRAGGAKAIARRTGGGRPASLQAKQLAKLQKIIIGKNPKQLDFGVVLWTVPIVQKLIARQFDVTLHATTVARVLHKLGLSPQKPTRRAFQRDDDACKHWAEQEFPKVVKEVKKKQATLLFLDEAGVHEDAPVGTTWAKKGERPTVRVSGARRRINVISAISPRGRLWFRCFNGTLTAVRFVEFLRGLLQDVRGKVCLVLDRHPAHVAAATRRFIAERKDRLSVHFLPPYAPDMNPDEHVWSHLKGMFRSDPLGEEEKFEQAVMGSMLEIQEDRSLVRRFFGHPAVQYVKKALGW